MHRAVPVHRAARGDQCLAGDLAAEGPLQFFLRAAAAEDVQLDLLQIEQLDEPVDGRSHFLCFFSQQRVGVFRFRQPPQLGAPTWAVAWALRRSANARPSSQLAARAISARYFMIAVG